MEQVRIKTQEDREWDEMMHEVKLYFYGILTGIPIGILVSNLLFY